MRVPSEVLMEPKSGRRSSRRPIQKYRRHHRPIDSASRLPHVSVHKVDREPMEIYMSTGPMIFFVGSVMRVSKRSDEGQLS
jgi:hypothetical protein